MITSFSKSKKEVIIKLTFLDLKDEKKIFNEFLSFFKKELRVSGLSEEEKTAVFISAIKEKITILSHYVDKYNTIKPNHDIEHSALFSEKCWQIVRELFEFLSFAYSLNFWQSPNLIAQSSNMKGYGQNNLSFCESYQRSLILPTKKEFFFNSLFLKKTEKNIVNTTLYASGCSAYATIMTYLKREMNKNDILLFPEMFYRELNVKHFGFDFNIIKYKNTDLVNIEKLIAVYHPCAIYIEPIAKDDQNLTFST